MEKNIAVIRGDGIGPEIVNAALAVLDAVAERFGHKFNYEDVDMGGCSIDKYGVPLTEEAIAKCLASDSVLLGAIGGYKWDKLPGDIRPERGLLGLRSAMGLYSNVRPARLFPQLAFASPLKPEIVARGIDLVIVRELIGGVYFGEHKTEVIDGEKKATDVMRYTEHEIERLLHIAFKMAQKRRKKVTMIDKANVLDTSKLWRELGYKIAGQYPDIAYDYMLVDNTAMQLVKDPSQFDVVVTENMFGDILSDEASMITGSIGMIPSSSLGETGVGMYEPIHGSAPDIAGQNIANPIGTILSAAMMLKYSFDMDAESDAVEAAVNQVLDDGIRTVDIYSDGMTKVSCSEMGEKVAAAVLAAK